MKDDGVDMEPVGAEAGEAFAPATPDPIVIDPLAKIGDLAAAAGIRTIEMVAWRDLEHPEAGGSELHAARIAERWAAAGLDLRIVASRFDGAGDRAWRDGYRLERPAGRYGIFPAVGARRLAGRLRAVADRARSGTTGGIGYRSPRRCPDATIEVWNGMPFFSPLWSPRPRVVFVHHAHDGMWDLVLPRSLAVLGRLVEARIAPPVYRRTPVVTLSESSRRAIIELLRFDSRQVTVVEPGVDDSFGPGPTRSPVPLVVAVGRLVTYKRFDRLVEVLVRLRRRHPTLRAVIAGEGSERPALEALVASHGAREWLELPGRIDDDRLLELYQSAWVLASPSAFEGWGLTITEAAACATPAVVSPIAGHRDAVADGVTGFLAEPGPEMERRIDELLGDAVLRRRMQKAARLRAERLTWDRTALGVLRVVAAESGRRTEPKP